MIELAEPSAAFGSSSAQMLLVAIFDSLGAWLSAAYARAPALVLGLAVLIALPPLTLLGFFLRRAPPMQGVDATRVYRRSTTGERHARDAAEADTPHWPAAAWVDVAGQRHNVGSGGLRLGRDEDNDICLPDKTVHRYHAAIHRTDDAEYLITDLSSAGGNGVLVNGLRVGETRLQDGDIIDLGQTRLKFVARPA